MTKLSTLIRQMAKEGHRLASLERASVLSASDDPKDQDKAREIRVRHDYENLRKQISSKKKPTKPAIKEGMGNIAHTKTKKGGKTIINVSKNDEADAQKAMKNDPKYILGKTRVQPYKEEVKRDEYGDPVGGPKISKKKKAKNLSSNTPDEQHTTTTSEAKVDKGRSDYGKASIRNYRRMGPGHGDPGMFDPEGKRGKTIDKRREEHKARRGVKGAKVPAYKVEEVESVEEKIKYDKSGSSMDYFLGADPKKTEYYKKNVKKKTKKEEVEVVNEVSKKTLGSYVKKAATEIGTSAIKGDYKKMQKRHKGVLDATDKMAKEEVEQIDELSKTTTANYLYHAKVDKNYVHGGKMGKYAKARDKGIKRAEKKLGKKTSDRVNYVADYDTRSMRQDTSKSEYPRKIKVKEEVEIEEGKKKGLWDRIHAKRERIKAGSGEKKAKPGDKDYPKTLNVEGAAWTKKAGKNPEGGLNEKGRKSYERENPGSDLKAPQPEGGSRKKSFCARMGGMKKKLTSSKTANDPDSRINKALRKWKCNETVAGGVPLTPQELEIQKKMSRLNIRLAKKRSQQMQKAKINDTETAPEQVKEEDKAFNTVVAALRKKHGKDAVITKVSKPKPPTEAQKKKAAAERKKRQDADNKAFAARAKKAGYKNPQDYANVVARYGSEDNYRKGKGLGT